jgi:S-adenosylmethionine synthetase
VSRANYLFTSESVSEGHPDKVCDRISDAVVDLYLAADPLSRVAIETLVTTNRIVMAGEVRGPESVTPELIEAAARRAVREIGYEQKGFHWDLAEFQNYVHEQSADIALGVDPNAEKQKEEGAGDQASCSDLLVARPSRSCPRRSSMPIASCTRWPRRGIPAERRSLGPTPRAR